jgi:hypothetical protein
LVGLLPIVGFMHGTWPPFTWVDGTVLRLASALAIVGATVVALWSLTGDGSWLRASVLTGLGLIGLAATAVVALVAPGSVIAVVAFWLVWPSLVLVIVWGQRAARRKATAT